MSKKKAQLVEKTRENEKLISELQAKKDEIYSTVKDFTLSANKTDIAISKMKEIDTEIKRIKNKVRKDKIAYNEL